MIQSLHLVDDWDVLAREAGYRRRKLAAICQISLRTLERHFHKHYRLTVNRWLRQLRLQEAYRQLQDGASVKEVAYAFGYKQLSHFSRDFKQQFGVAPSFLLPRNQPARQESPTSPQLVFTF